MVNGGPSGSDILVIRVGCRRTTCGVLAATYLLFSLSVALGTRE